MKKRIKTKQLGRDRQARQALFRGLVSSFVKHGEIQTTAAKAKAVRSIIEKMLTKGREGSLAARRQLQAELQDKALVKKLVDELAPQFKKKPGGYTKVTQVGKRRGDNAQIVKLSLSTSQAAKDPKKLPAGKSKLTTKASKTTKASTQKAVPATSPTPKDLKPTKNAPAAQASSHTGVRQGER